MSFIKSTVELLPRTDPVVIFTCPADTVVTLSTISVYSSTNEAGAFTLYLYRQSSGETFRLMTRRRVETNEPYDYSKPIMLEPGDYVSAVGDDAPLVVDVGGVTIGAATNSKAFVPRGTYNADATYQRLHLAEFEGSTYVALVDNLSGDAPPSVNWMLFASKGNTGAAGDSFLPNDVRLRFALSGVLPSDEIIKKGNRWILLQDTYLQRDVDLTGIEIENPFGVRFMLTETDPATRRILPLIHEDETIDDLQALGTLRIAQDTTLTVNGTLEILPV